MNFNFLVCCAFALAVTNSMAQIQSPGVSPSPSDFPGPLVVTRPTIPELYLSGAGPLPVSETKMSSFSVVDVCPANFGAGWTVRCATTSSSSVIFRVKGALFKKEFFAPYYLNGNWGTGSSIRPYEIGQDTMQRISCKVRTRKPVWVDIRIKC